TRPTATPMLQRAWRSIRGSCTYPRRLRPVPGLTSPSSRRRRKTSVERIALAHAACGVCVKLSSMKQKGPRSNAREGRCCTKLSTRCRANPRRKRPIFVYVEVRHAWQAVPIDEQHAHNERRSGPGYAASLRSRDPGREALLCATITLDPFALGCHRLGCHPMLDFILDTTS